MIRHRSSLSRVGASDKPGVVHIASLNRPSVETAVAAVVADSSVSRLRSSRSSAATAAVRMSRNRIRAANLDQEFDKHSEGACHA